MNIFSIFTTIVFNPILIVLMAIYHGLLVIHVSNALGWSIILLTVAIRLVLYPLTGAQLKASKKMQAITPHLNLLKEKHKNDQAMLQKETMRLYKEHGVNPVAGCLPLFIQLPIIWGLYAVLQLIVSTNAKHVISVVNSATALFPALQIHKAIDPHFFGLLLGQSPSHLLGSVGGGILLFPVATALFQLIQSKMMFGAPVSEETKSIQAKTGSDDFASAFQAQSLYIFPLMIGFFSYTLPLGLSLYWNTFTIFGIIQQYQISGWGSLSSWIPFLKK